MFGNILPELGAYLRTSLSELVADARTGPGGRLFNKLTAWVLILMILAVGPVAVFLALLAGTGLLDGFLKAPPSSIVGMLLALVVGATLGWIFGARARRRGSDER